MTISLLYKLATICTYIAVKIEQRELRNTYHTYQYDGDAISGHQLQDIGFNTEGFITAQKQPSHYKAKRSIAALRHKYRLSAA